MGVRELGFSLIFFMHLLHSVSPSPVRKTLPSAFMQNSKVEDRDVYESKIEGGGTSHGGMGGGKAPNNGENGGSATPNTPGGAAVIPVYTAGAANSNRNHQNHRGAGNCNLRRLEFPTLLMIMGVSTLVQLCLFA